MKKISLLLNNNLTYIILLIISIIYFFICSGVEQKRVSLVDENEIEGTIFKKVISENKISFWVDDKEKILCNFYTDNDDEKLGLWNTIPLGSKVKIRGNLKEPLNNTIPNTFNYKEYLKNQDIYNLCTIEEIDVIKSKTNLFFTLKNAIIDRIMTFKVRDYLYTMIIGDKSLMEDDTLDKYRDNGITHLFAISGMHIGLFAMIISKILKKCKIKDSKASIIVSLFIWLYAFLAGFGASVVRAGLLFTYMAIDKLLDLRLSKLKILYLVGFTLFFYRFKIVFDLGFIYSFITTFGLIFANKVIEKHKVTGTSLVANLFSLPITINNFFKINLASVLFNIFFVPFVSFVIYPLCLLTFFLRWIEPLTIFMIKVLEKSNDICARFTLGTFVIPKMSFVVVLIYYAILLFIHKNGLYKTTAILIAIVLLNKIKPMLDMNSYVEFLDVGQGDSILIRYKGNKEVVLIDTGGKTTFNNKSTYNVSANTITYLNSLGIEHIDYLILTHGDYDHMGEATYLVENYRVEKVIFNCGAYNDLEKELIKVLEKKNIDYSSCIDELNIASNRLYFLNTKEYDNENDHSNVVYTELNNYKFLFMGDVSTTTEEEILDKYNLSNIDILKVGHHGSKTSSSKEFIDTINPKYSLISVGKNNRYGHPNKETLENLKDSKIYRTDVDGSIKVKIKKNTLDIETCPP